jgi:hypothetical protein
MTRRRPRHVDVLDLHRFRSPRSGAEVLELRVDGRNLIDLVREAEAASAAGDAQSELAGSYVGPDLWRITDIRAHLLGRHDRLFDYEGRTELLLCGDCGEAGCWPFAVRITVDEHTVRWGDYQQPHRPHWRYDRLPEFVFDCRQYEAAIARVIQRGADS